jgi:tetratricopeptide (TPR) repeat protein
MISLRFPSCVRLLCLLIIAGAMWPATASADEIKYGGVTYPNIRIIGLRDGRLIFQTSAGTENQVALADVEAIRVNAHPELAQADAAIEKKDFAEAARLLGSIVDKVKEDYLKILTRAKLAIVLDRADKPVEAMTQFLLLLRMDQGELTQAAMPRKQPTDEKLRKRIADMVDAELKATADLRVKQMLEPLATSLKAAPGQAPVPAPEQGTSPGPALLVGEAEAARDLIEEALAAGDAKKALALTDRDLDNSKVDLSKLLYQRGRALAALDKDIDAAMAFMRVAIHYGRSDYAVPALIGAGKVFTKMNQKSDAQTALQEAKSLSRDDAQIQEIDQLLNALK